HPNPSSSWKFVAVILWIICLGLLSSVGYLAIECKSQREIEVCFSITHVFGNILLVQTTGISMEKTATVFKETHFLGKNNFIIKLSKMQCGMQKEKFSISLYYNYQQLKWVWLDGTQLTLNK
ncbi:hypothetical protein E2I00_015351, partial [Balaenoptera physalus]